MTITTLITNTKSTLTFMDVRNAKMPSSVGSSMPMLTKLYVKIETKIFYIIYIYILNIIEIILKKIILLIKY